jgi:hypothetical protein
MGRNPVDEKDKVKAVNVYVKSSVIEKVGGLQEAKLKARKFLEKEALKNLENEKKEN